MHISYKSFCDTRFRVLFLIHLASAGIFVIYIKTSNANGIVELSSIIMLLASLPWSIAWLFLAEALPEKARVFVIVLGMASSVGLNISIIINLIWFNLFKLITRHSSKTPN